MSVPPLIGYTDSMTSVSFTPHHMHMHSFHWVFVVCVGKRRYNIRLWKTFTDCFNCLPVAAILDEKIFCCHGGEREGGMACNWVTRLVLVLAPISYVPFPYPLYIIIICRSVP